MRLVHELQGVCRARGQLVRCMISSIQLRLKCSELRHAEVLPNRLLLSICDVRAHPCLGKFCRKSFLGVGPPCPLATKKRTFRELFCMSG